MELSLVLNIIGALFIAFIWLYYLRQLDVFHPESWFNIFIVFISGMITPIFVLKISPVFDHFQWGINGEIANDFIFSVFGIGFIEELAKILPVLLILFVGSKTDEPIDFIIFASASALGFATTENILYFQNSGSEIITLRALLSVLGHMTDTSIVAYAFVIYHFSKKRNALLLFLYFLLLAALAHGLYDFFLLNKYFSEFGILLTLLSYFIFIEIWATINNNCLNNSPHFDLRTTIDSEKLQLNLMRLFIGLVIYQFIAVFIQKDFEHGLLSVSMGIFMTTLVALVVTTRISRFKLIPNRWEPIRFRLPFKFNGIPFLGGYITVRGDSINEIHASKLLYTTVTLYPFNDKKSKIKKPIQAYVENKLFLKNDEVFFLLRTEETFNWPQFVNHTFLIKARTEGLKLRYGKYPMASLYLIPKDHTITEKDDLKNFAFIEWVYIKP